MLTGPVGVVDAAEAVPQSDPEQQRPERRTTHRVLRRRVGAPVNWVLANLDTIWDNTLAHLAIAIPPIIIAFLLSIPIGWLVVRLQRPGGSRVASGVGAAS